MNMTETDRQVLKDIKRKFGNGEWFDAFDIHWMFKSPEYRCKRLTTLGFLKKRIEEDKWHIKYCLSESADCQAT